MASSSSRRFRSRAGSILAARTVAWLVPGTQITGPLAVTDAHSGVADWSGNDGEGRQPALWLVRCRCDSDRTVMRVFEIAAKS